MTKITGQFGQAFTPKLIIAWREGQLAKLWHRDVLLALP